MTEVFKPEPNMAPELDPTAPRASIVDYSASRLPHKRAGIAAGLTFAIAAGGVLSVNAQDSENPQTAVLLDPLDPNCSPTIALESPVPGSSPSVELPTGDLVVFESPAPSPLPVTLEEEQGEQTAQLSGETVTENCASETSPYSIEALLNEDLGKITNAEIKRIIKKSSVTLAKYYRDSGVIPNDTLHEEQKYWNDQFKKWLKVTDVDVEGQNFARQVVLNIVNTNKVKKSGDIDATDAIMNITRAHYRAGLSFLREDSGKLIDRAKFDAWITEASVADDIKEISEEEGIQIHSPENPQEVSAS